MERILEMSAIGTEEGAAARQLALVDSVLAEMRWRGRRNDMVGGGRGGRCREGEGRERSGQGGENGLVQFLPRVYLLGPQESIKATHVYVLRYTTANQDPVLLQATTNEIRLSLSSSEYDL